MPALQIVQSNSSQIIQVKPAINVQVAVIIVSPAPNVCDVNPVFSKLIKIVALNVPTISTPTHFLAPAMPAQLFVQPAPVHPVINAQTVQNFIICTMAAVTIFVHLKLSKMFNLDNVFPVKNNAKLVQTRNAARVVKFFPIY